MKLKVYGFIGHHTIVDEDSGKTLASFNDLPYPFHSGAMAEHYKTLLSSKDYQPVTLKALLRKWFAR